MNISHANQHIDDMKRFVDWSRKLSWPNVVTQLFNTSLSHNEDEEHDNLHFNLMQRVLMEEKRITREEYNKLKENGDRERSEHLFKIEDLKKQLKQLKRAHKSSMAQLPNPFTVESQEAAEHLLQDQNASRIMMLQKQLEKQKREHLKDKEQFAMNTMQELNRLRNEMRDVGLAQQLEAERKRKKQQQLDSQQAASYYNYLTSATSYIWNVKK